jgi:hypothetical protein
MPYTGNLISLPFLLHGATCVQSLNARSRSLEFKSNQRVSLTDDVHGCRSIFGSAFASCCVSSSSLDLHCVVSHGKSQTDRRRQHLKTVFISSAIPSELLMMCVSRPQCSRLLPRWDDVRSHLLRAVKRDLRRTQGASVFDSVLLMQCGTGIQRRAKGAGRQGCWTPVRWNLPDHARSSQPLRMTLLQASSGTSSSTIS